MIKVKCLNCGYEWIYKGMLIKPVCPSCTRRVNLERKEEKENGI
jgi:hypothetical protein